MLLAHTSVELLVNHRNACAGLRASWDVFSLSPMAAFGKGNYNKVEEMLDKLFIPLQHFLKGNRFH